MWLPAYLQPPPRATLTAGAGRCPLRAEETHHCTPLCPWFTYLHGILDVEYTHEPYQSKLLRPSRFHALVLHVYPTNVWEVLEAIDLVLLAVALDPRNAWKRVVRVGCKVPDFVPRSHVVDELAPRLRMVLHGETALSKTLPWLEKHWLRSPAYLLARQWLLHQHERGREHYKLTPMIPLVMDLVFKNTLGQVTQPLADSLVRLAHTMPVRGRYCCSYRLVAVNCQVGGSALTNPQVLRMLQQSGVWIKSITVASSAACDIAELMHGSVRPLETITFENFGNGWSIQWWQRLRTARSVKEVSIGQGFFSGRSPDFQIARAVAIALLDPRSPTSVEHVHIRSPLNGYKMHAMIEVLRMRDPLDAVGWDRTTTTDDHHVRRPGLRSLSLMVTSPGDVTVLVALLQLVGSGLESLSLHLDVRVLDDDELVLILAACPQLRCLCLRETTIETMAPIINAYERGFCGSLESLVFDGRVADATSVIGLFAACNDPASKVHTTLCDLEFSQLSYSRDVRRQLLALIKLNRTLRHVGLDLTRFSSKDNRDDLEEMALNPVYFKPVRLETTQIVAVLSVLSSKLNQDTCRHVVAFAHGMERRKILNHLTRKHGIQS